MRWIMILLIFAFFSTLHGQSYTSIAGKSLLELKQFQSFQPKKVSLINPVLPPVKPSSTEEAPLAFNRFDILQSAATKPFNSSPLIYNYYELAFFCKIEVELEKSVQLPVKFRLGSVDYVDWLEGKRDRY